MKKYIKPALTAVPVYVECAVTLGSNPPVNPPVNPNPKPNGIPVTDGTFSFDAPKYYGLKED